MEGSPLPRSTLPPIPPEIWAHTLSFLDPREEFVGALVCRDWYAILRRRRERRGEAKWTTWPSVLCGSVESIEYARRELALPWDGRAWKSAAARGRVAVLEYLEDQGCSTEKNLFGKVFGYRGLSMDAAAFHGRLDAVIWLRGRRFPWNENTCAHAAKSGRLSVLRYMHENACPWTSLTTYNAAIGGHLQVLQYAREHGCDLHEVSCNAAIQHGHLEVVRYLCESGLDSPHGVVLATQAGCLSVLKYFLHRQRFPSLEQLMLLAAEHGHVPILEYLFELGIETPAEASRAAATNGHLSVLQFFRQQDIPCDWDQSVTSAAAAHGHLQVLQFLVHSGCPWDLDESLRSSHQRIRDWAAETAAK